MRQMTYSGCQTKCRMVAGLAGSYGFHWLAAGRPVATKAAAVREKAVASDLAAVVGSPTMGLPE